MSNKLKKDSRKNDTAEKILLATAITKLLSSLIDLIIKLID